MIRRLAATLAAVALLVALAAPVLAGGWAEIVADTQTVEPPVEGRPVDVGFLVLQHGETPAGWVTATVHFMNSSSGETIDVVAKNDRKDGHFTARTVLPEAGYWSWQVTLMDLESDHMPVSFPVAAASGQVPAYDPATTATAIARAKADVTEQLGAQFYPEIERLEGIIRAEQAKTNRVLEQTNAIVSERDELATRLAAAEGAGGLPLIAILTLAVLAGATAGFAMSWLAGRPSPKVVVSPAPRGTDPA